MVRGCGHTRGPYIKSRSVVYETRLFGSVCFVPCLHGVVHLLGGFLYLVLLGHSYVNGLRAGGFFDLPFFLMNPTRSFIVILPGGGWYFARLWGEYQLCFVCSIVFLDSENIG